MRAFGYAGQLSRVARREELFTSTVEITLASLLKEGYIIKTGAGKNTAYIRNMDRPNVDTE